MIISQILTMKKIWESAVISPFNLLLNDIVGIHSNTTNMTEFEKFQAFKEHNCLPLITLEGVEGTKL